MTDELDLLASIRPEYAVHDTPPPLNWAALQTASPGDPRSAYPAARCARWAWLSAAAAVIIVLGAVLSFSQTDQPAHMAPPPAEATTSAAAPESVSPALTPRLAELADARCHPGASLTDAAIDDVAERTDGTTASFAKELVRRAVLLAVADDAEPTDEHLYQALDDLSTQSQRATRGLLGETPG